MVFQSLRRASSFRRFFMAILVSLTLRKEEGIQMEWKDKYVKNTKPTYDELLNFFAPDIRELFLRFDRAVNEKFKVHNKHHRYKGSSGWIYGFGRNYNCELFSVGIQGEGFKVLGITVKDENTLQSAIDKVQKIYDDGFEERYETICTKQRTKQIELSKRRVEREKLEMDKILENVDPEKLNQFKWCRKISRNDLLKLYTSEAKGMLDIDLLDEVGFAFYTRCKQAHEARDCMEKEQILCHYCGAILDAEDRLLPVHCQCGYSYTHREYRRSYMAVNMPGNRATPIFEHFEQKWPGCKNSTEKMILIDWLIHECHVTLMSGAKGKSVCENLIEGTRKQITDLIVGLAYGNGKENDK